ncbi:hypothetical protein [Glutamicibacter sp. NPDC087344]|uniref:hypothetical protein n=1 Tax=Glutamicibacter sp. NPDC087344 TaxID=3363994 RepID=UPI0038290691
MIEAIAYYVAKQAGTTEFSILDSQTDYLLRIKSKNSEALKMLEKTFTKSGYETGCIGFVLIVWLQPNDVLKSAAMTAYNEAQGV